MWSCTDDAHGTSRSSAPNSNITGDITALPADYWLWVCSYRQKNNVICVCVSVQLNSAHSLNVSVIQHRAALKIHTAWKKILPTATRMKPFQDLGEESGKAKFHFREIIWTEHCRKLLFFLHLTVLQSVEVGRHQSEDVTLVMWHPREVKIKRNDECELNTWFKLICIWHCEHPFTNTLTACSVLMGVIDYFDTEEKLQTLRFLGQSQKTGGGFRS